MLLNKQFGNYQIIRKLGRGMTDVYLAFDTKSNRNAVLKIIEESADPLTQLVMQAERRGAQLQQQLHALDARILEVYEFGDLDGYFFLAMQYVEGQTIAEILKQDKRIDPKRAASFSAEICSQLSRLHSFMADIDGEKRAVLHGDIKPANIQIGAGDEVRLLDFGIAKAITFTHSLTHHNLGSPSYCSPERLSLGHVDYYADLWAVGVTLYEMVAGSPPYQAQDTRKLENLIQARRPPRALPEDCPPALKAIIWKALAADLRQRYRSAEAFGSDLTLFLQGRATVAEGQPAAAWHSNATVDKPRAHPSHNATVAAPQTGPRAPRIAATVNVLSAMCWGLVAGFLVFGTAGLAYRYWSQSGPLRKGTDYAHESISQINSDWELYRRLERQNSFLGPLSPVYGLRPRFRVSLIDTGDEILDRYRSSNDPKLADFDWLKAQAVFQHARDLDEHDRMVRGKLALATAYVNLLRGQPEPAKEEFEQANKFMPRSPDPHIGLARVYVYSDRNIGQALAEFHEAQRLGYQLGPREMEQEADGYRFRAVDELAEAVKDHDSGILQLAQRDFDRARQLYEPILGFSNVRIAMKAVNDGEHRRQIIDISLRPSAPVKVQRGSANRRRRWQ